MGRVGASSGKVSLVGGAGLAADCRLLVVFFFLFSVFCCVLPVRVGGGSVSANFQISTFNGDIQSDFGEMNITQEDFIPAKEARFTVGGGDSSVSIETFGGAE